MLQHFPPFCSNSSFTRWNSQKARRVSEIPSQTSAAVLFGTRFWLDIPSLLFLCSALQRENKDITGSVYPGSWLIAACWFLGSCLNKIHCTQTHSLQQKHNQSVIQKVCNRVFFLLSNVFLLLQNWGQNRGQVFGFAFVKYREHCKQKWGIA